MLLQLQAAVCLDQGQNTSNPRKLPPLFAAPLPTPLSPCAEKPLGSAACPRGLPWASTSRPSLFFHLQDIWSDNLYLKDEYNCGTQIPFSKVKQASGMNGLPANLMPLHHSWNEVMPTAGYLKHVIHSLVLTFFFLNKKVCYLYF